MLRSGMFCDKNNLGNVGNRWCECLILASSLHAEVSRHVSWQKQPQKRWYECLILASSLHAEVRPCLPWFVAKTLPAAMPEWWHTSCSLLLWWVVSCSLWLYIVYCGNLHKYTHSLESRMYSIGLSNLRNMWWVINDEFVFVCFMCSLLYSFHCRSRGIFSWILSTWTLPSLSGTQSYSGTTLYLWSIGDTVPMKNTIAWVWTSYPQQTIFLLLLWLVGAHSLQRKELSGE